MAAIFSLQLKCSYDICLNNILRIRHVLGQMCVESCFMTKTCYKTLCETSCSTGDEDRKHLFITLI